MDDHHIKRGAGAASVRGLRPEMAIAWTLIVMVMERRGCVARLSSGTDGRHTRGSSHYRGHAIDVSKRDIDVQKHDEILIAMRRALGDDYDVIDEATHWHVQFKPKGPL